MQYTAQLLSQTVARLQYTAQLLSVSYSIKQ